MFLRIGVVRHGPAQSHCARDPARTGQLWAVVNERDELGPDLPPDYLTSMREGAFYVWPYSYWGQNVDPRVRPQDPQKVAAALALDYALGTHVAAPGLGFSSAAMGAEVADGAFVGEHGSWNREQLAGYKVVFVPFRDRRPTVDDRRACAAPRGRHRLDCGRRHRRTP